MAASTDVSTDLPYSEQSKLGRLKRRHAALKSERSQWDPAWKEAAENILPRRARFFTQDTNKGARKESKIFNSKPTSASRTQASGMMASISSPARKWMKITTSLPQLREMSSVKEWLDIVEERVLAAFSKSNIYNCLHNVYADIGTFGTSAMLVEEDADTVVRAYVFPIGSYCLSQNARGEVDTVYREFQMSSRQLVEMFGEDGCSQTVKDDVKQGRLDNWHDVVLCVQPNTDYAPGHIGAKGKEFATCWYEARSPEVGPDAKLLRESGYSEWPLMTPRWNITGEDVWGTGPGTEALADAKMLQLLEKRKMQAFDKVVNPPMRAPTSLMGGRSSLLPGDVTYVDSNSPGQTFSPAMELNPMALPAFRQEIRECEMRIEDAYFASLWLTMQRIDSGKMTATEVTARQQEQMLLLGPVMERLEDELLRPLVERVYSVLLRTNAIPPPPMELEGQELKIDYISIMAQAQKLLGTANIERLATFVGHLVGVDPTAIDKLDLDQTIDEYSDAIGVPANIIRSDDKVAEIRASRAEAAAKQAQAQDAAAAAEGAKVLSETDTGGDNALNRLLGNLSSPPVA